MKIIQINDDHAKLLRDALLPQTGKTLCPHHPAEKQQQVTDIITNLLNQLQRET